MPREKPKPNAKHPNRYWGAKQLPETKAEFFDAITTPAPDGDGSVATIRMYGPIDSWGGWWGISAKDVGDVLDALPESVQQIILRINSPGGEVFEGVSILNMFRAHRAAVTAVVDGLAASAASFIAAGCDETVMSPGTQLMIHSPSTFTYGNSGDLRKTADVLDKIEASIVEIYTAKAGDKDWATLLAEDTWMTAAEAVALGLADRIAVIPNAGETDTVGADEDEELIVLPDEDEPEDSAARLVRVIARAPAAHHKPRSLERGSAAPKENAMASDTLTAGLRDRLGVTAADASDETLLAALDEALAERADTPTVPEGTTLIDSAVLADLQAKAVDGQQARAKQRQDEREGIVDAAIREGRITASTREAWLGQLEKNQDGTAALLKTLPVNTVPRTELGRSDEPTEDDVLYDKAFGAAEKKD